MMDKKSKVIWKLRGVIVCLVVIALVSCLLVLGQNNQTISSVFERLRFNPQRCDDAQGAFAFYNVGNGDASCVYTNHQIGMIDVGPENMAAHIVKTIQQLKTEALDFLIISHPHADHVGGCLKVMEKIQVKKLFVYQYDENDFENMYLYNSILQYAKEAGTEIVYVTNGMTAEIGKIHLQFFEYAIGEQDDNDNSLVVKASIGDVSCLYTGDSGFYVEKNLLFNGYDLQSDILKVAHHGSKNTTSYEFLQAVSPKYAVVCVGPNQYGHPTEETLNRLNNANITVYSTDCFHKAIFLVNQNDIEINIQ